MFLRLAAYYFFGMDFTVNDVLGTELSSGNAYRQGASAERFATTAHDSAEYERMLYSFIRFGNAVELERFLADYQRLKGRDVITDPKTPKSVRVVQMPSFLTDEIRDYLKSLYGVKPDDRIFDMSKSYLHHEMDRGAKAAGVKRIRIHDLRHSHISLLIDMGFSAAKEIGLWPYYMYRQKYQNGNLENVGYAADGKLCVYNVDMMEETTSILAQGAGAMTKRVFDSENRVERIPNPKDVPTYGAKLDLLDRQKRAMFFL
jgi:hypothetical protein